MSTPRRPQRPPSLLACTNCRAKHLKCDAKTPECGRCEWRGYECTYTESRRGYKSNNRNSFNQLEFDDLDSSTSPDQCSSQPWQSDIVTTYVQSDFTVPMTRTICDGASLNNDQSLVLFYRFFYPAHPFVVPMTFYKLHPTVLPQYLTDVMRLLGTQYRSHPSPQSLRSKVLAALSSSLPEDAFSVQALLLFGMFAYARFEQSLGACMIDRAVDLALRIGLNTKRYSDQNVANDSVLRESYWRTWWDLYMVDGMMSAIAGAAHVIRLQDTMTDVPVPGSDDCYHECLPQSSLMQIEDMRNRVFFNDELSWSSYAYKIEAMHIMSNVLALGPDTFATKQKEVESLDASISSFLLSVHAGQAQLAEREQRVDELLFGAHMIVHWAAIIYIDPDRNWCL